MLIYPDEVNRFNFERSNFITEVSPYQLWTPDPAIRHWPKIIVINQNLLEIPPHKIHETKVLKTVLKGHTVYEGK